MGIQIKVEGKEVAKSLVDLFSPLTEMAGTIGDQVRVYREITLLKTLKKAKQKIEAEGLNIDPPPLKFLIPFIEQCSLESDDDEVIMNMWSNLLVSASKNYKPEQNIFIRILNEITPSEAQALDYIVFNEAHKVCKHGAHLRDVHMDWREHYIYSSLKNVFALYKSQINEITDFKIIEDKLKEERLTPGSVIHWFCVNPTHKEKDLPYYIGYNNDRDPIEDFDMSVPILKSLGLIEELKTPVYSLWGYDFEINAYYITELGGQFYQECTASNGYVKSQQESD